MDLKPLVSENFNIFLELPLKTLTRKKKIKIISINWQNRKGASKVTYNYYSREKGPVTVQSHHANSNTKHEIIKGRRSNL